MPANPNVNRVSAMIAQHQQNIAHRLASGQITQARIDKLRKELDMDIGEYCRFQNLKSLACVGGLLTTEEGQLIYQYLGESLETFNAQPVEVKAVLTQVFEELLNMQIKAKRRTG